LFADHQSNTITLPVSSGILSVPNVYVAVTVAQNGKYLYPNLEFTVSGNTITIDSDTHFNGSNYLVKVHDVI